MMKHFFLIVVVLVISSCNTKVKQDKISEVEQPKDTILQNEKVFLIPSKISISTTHFFSNLLFQDTFVLTVDSGLVETSKSRLEIKTTDNRVVYTQEFSPLYLFHWAEESDDMKRLYKDSLQHFFDEVQHINREELKDWQQHAESTNENFYNEVLADTTINLYYILCYSCEGGWIVGYSKLQQKVDTLSEISPY